METDKNSILALDIGTEFVKALIARCDPKSGSISVVGQGKVHQDPINMHAGAIADIEGTISVCERAIHAAEQEAGLTAKKTVVGVAGELVKGKTSTVHYRRQNSSRPLSEQEMSLILEKVQQKTGEEARAAIALETGNDNVEIRLINSAVVSLVIDGYKISNPIGFKGSELQIQIYTAFAPLVHISAIEKVCSELALDLIAVAVEPFAVCRACLGDEPDNDFSAIVMDIGGGTTDIAVVSNGGVEGTKMFSIGGRSFTSCVARSLGVSQDTAEKYKLKVDGDDLSPRIRQRTAAALKKNTGVWLSGVEIALDEFDSAEILPSRVILCGGGATLGVLQESLALEDWYKNLPFAKRPLIELLDFAALPGFENATDDNIDCTFATALGLLRVGFDTELGAPESNSLRDKLARLLQN